jgi:nucleotide-binding universal stress UspA family protein
MLLCRTRVFLTLKGVNVWCFTSDSTHLALCHQTPYFDVWSVNILPHLQEVSMATLLKPSWSKPSTILFASEIPTNEKAFAFALAQAQEFGAKLILFHAYDTLVVAASETSGIRYYDYASAARAEMEHLEPLAKRVRDAGVQCETVVRPGLAADQVLALLREREIDRIIMGTHSPGPIGKLLVGSVAEAVLRTAKVPVFTVGPDVVDGSYRNFSLRTILCAVSLHTSNRLVTSFAAELAAKHNARLILEHVIRPQERQEVLANRTIEQLEAELMSLIPEELQGKFATQTIVVPGDPTDCAGGAGRIGFCSHRPPGSGLQGRGSLALPGDDAVAGGAGGLRREARKGSLGRGGSTRRLIERRSKNCQSSGGGALPSVQASMSLLFCFFAGAKEAAPS